MVAAVKALVQPYSLLLVALGFSLWLRGRNRPDDAPRRRWLWIPDLLLILFSTPAMAYLVRGWLEWQNPPLVKRPANAQAIVVLGGSLIQPGDWKIPGELNRAAVKRSQHGARHYLAGEPCPVLISAGPAQAYPIEKTCAELMADLTIGLGVSREWVLTENASTNTHDNAVNCARILKEKGITRIVLVTDATHLPRAAACFRKQGLTVVPAGVYYLSNRWKTRPEMFVPSAQAVGTMQEVTHEGIGLLWYWLRDWI